MGEKKTTREQLSARIDRTVLATIEQIAVAEHRSVSNLVGVVLSDFVKSREPGNEEVTA